MKTINTSEWKWTDGNIDYVNEQWNIEMEIQALWNQRGVFLFYLFYVYTIIIILRKIGAQDLLYLSWSRFTCVSVNIVGRRVQLSNLHCPSQYVV